MRILFLSEHHPGSQGGIQTFGRVLKKFFREKLIFLVFEKENKEFKEIFFVDDVYKLDEESVFFRILKKLLRSRKLRNKFKEHIYDKNINRFSPDIVFLGFPREINYIKSREIKKILVQHTNYEVFVSNFCNNNFKVIEKLKKELDMFVFLSEYDREKFIKKLKLSREKTTVIRHSCELEKLGGGVP